MYYFFIKLFCLFIIYSFIGWIIEVLCIFYISKKFINRGFLIGPYCPIHGIGALSMLFLLQRYTDFLTLFIMSTVICSILEYIASYLLEKKFKARWWDYTNMPFNVNGRICLITSLEFGVLGVLLIKLINPTIINYLNNTNPILIMVVGSIILLGFIIDCICSFRIISNFKKTSEVMAKDCTTEVNDKVKKVINQKFIYFKRLLDAFPNLSSLNKDLSDKIKNIKK